MIKTLLALATLGLTSVVSAQEMIVPAPPSIGATAYIMMDANSGEVLIEHNADERLPPASLTKLMTAYVAEVELASGRMALSDMVPISENAWRTGGSKTFVLVDTEVEVEDLMRGIVIQSGNDASVAMAEYVAGSEENFVDIMNQYAQRLGMANTEFANSTGLPASDGRGFSTARDIALLSQRKIQDHPQYYGWYSEREFTFAGITQPNRNRLLWQNPNADGLKTGHTSEAGYSLAASAVEDGMRLITVVLGTSSEQARLQETQRMLSYGFRYFENQTLHNADTELYQGRIWAGARDQVGLGLSSDLSVTIPKGSADRLRSIVEVNSQLEAPVSVGDVLGTLIVRQGDNVIAERDLVALHSVEQGSLVKRIWDRIRLFFIGLFN